MTRPAICTIVVLTMLTMSLSHLSFDADAAPPTDGGTVTISGDEVWQGGTVNGHVIIPEGASLTIDDELWLEKGSSMHVEGDLIINSSSMKASEPPSDLMWWNSYMSASTWWVPAEVGFFTIEIVSAADYNLSNFTVQWNDGPKEDMAGSNHNISSSVIFTQEGGTLSFEMIQGEWGELVIDRIEIHRVTESYSIEASELDGDGWVLRGDPGFEVDVDSTGTITVENGLIHGGELQIAGSLVGNGSTMKDCGPVSINGDGSSVVWKNGSFNGSRDDHDLKLGPTTQKDLENFVGTGGFVDYWEVQLESQTIQFPGSGITFMISDVGPMGQTIHGHSMVDGTFVVPANRQDGPRVVEIGYSDGTVWTEDAKIENVSWFTAWGTYDSNGADLEKSENPLFEFDNLPNVRVTNVEVTEESTVGKRAFVDVTVENSGAGAANVPLECSVDGEPADISPIYPNAELAPGETETVEIRWGVASTGNHTLVCIPMIPSQVAIEGSLGGGGSDTNSIEWRSADVEEGSMLSPLLISVLVALVVGLLLVVYFRAMGDSDIMTSHAESDGLDDLDDLDDL